MISANKNDLDKSSVEEILPHPEKPKPLSSLHKTAWEWLQILVSVGVVGIFATAWWTIRSAHEATQRHNAELVQNYMDAVNELIFDEYHDTKDDTNVDLKLKKVELSNLLLTHKKPQSIMLAINMSSLGFTFRGNLPLKSLIVYNCYGGVQR